MRIKEDSIRKVLDATNIVEIIGSYVKLKPSGRNWVALCPFHKEKTPSFTVSRDKGLFYCFGCGTGGNVVSFLMKYEKLSFVEAIETLAKRLNIPLEYEDGFSREEDQELEKLYEYSQITARYFLENLFNTNEGSIALKYLKERGIEESTIKTFGLGYALSAWDGLVNFITKNNYDFETFEKLGLIIKKENGDYYDRFRGRIIFPILSSTGRVIAFGGRIINGDNEQPKYLNSPESRIYIKGKTLYGLFQTKDEIRKSQSAVLVEGYMDLLSLYQNGIKNVVASAGTALTLDQVNILNRITENINLIFDGDEAGQKAAIRAIELLLQTTTDFKIVSLPENEDPDSFIRKFGPTEFQSLVKSGKTYIDFVYDLASKHNSLNDFQNKLRVINSLLEYTAKVKDSLRREILAREIAKKFNVTESSVLQTLNKYVKDFEKFEVRQSEFERVSQTEKNLKATLIELHPVERGLIKLICDAEHIYLEPIFSNVEEEDFINPAAAEIFKTLKRHYFNLMSGEKINVQFIINDLEKDELKNVFSDILIERYEVSEGWTSGDDIPAKKIEPNKLMTDYIKKLKDLSLTKKINELQERLKTTNDLDESKNLLAEIEKLLSRKKDYQNLQIKIPD